MVRNSDKTYGEFLNEARQQTDPMELGEVTPGVFQAFKDKIEEAVQGQYEHNPVKNFYIHLFVMKDPYAANAIKICAHNRRTRPSPYQDFDHYLYSVTDYNNVKFEWCIPKKEITAQVLENPTLFHPEYVSLLRKYVSDTLENASDYVLKAEDIPDIYKSKVSSLISLA